MQLSILYNTPFGFLAGRPFTLPFMAIGTMMWVGIGSAVLGAGTAVMGQDAQRKATNKANDANKQAVSDTNATNAANVDKVNRLNWAQYLMSRGINPGTDVTPGVVPTNYTATNARLPLWAQVTRGAGRPTRSAAIGVAPNASPWRAVRAQPAAPAVPVSAAAPASTPYLN